MNKEIKLPKISENEDTGLISEVYVKEGDHVDVEDAIIAVESDKATVDVPLEYAGEIVSVDVKEGEEISIGDTILTLEIEDDEDSEEEKEQKKSVSENSSKSTEDGTKSQKKESEEDQDKVNSESESSKDSDDRKPKKEQKKSKEKDTKKADDASEVPAAPLARKFARELGIDIKEVNIDDSSDRITRENIFEHARKIIRQNQNAKQIDNVSGIELPDFSQWGNIERKPMSGIRRVTAEKTSLSWQNIPHVTQMDEADITNLENFRKENQENELSLTAILLKVIGFALQEFPDFNASLDIENEEIILKDFIHVGVAVDTDDGLLIPVIRDVDKKTLLELSEELKEKAENARNRDLTSDEMKGGNFVLSNLGGIGGTSFTPIIFPPQVAILGVSKAEIKPIFSENEFKPRAIMPLSLSYDHRLIDGADGARFFKEDLRYPPGTLESFHGKVISHISPKNEKMDSNNISFQLDEEQGKFIAKIDGSEAFIDYEMPKDDVIDLKHTFVPEKNRGRGIAKKLARHALDYARNNHLKIIPTCGFIKSFLKKNSEYRDLLKED